MPDNCSTAQIVGQIVAGIFFLGAGLYLIFRPKQWIQGTIRAYEFYIRLFKKPWAASIPIGLGILFAMVGFLMVVWPVAQYLRR